VNKTTSPGEGRRVLVTWSIPKYVGDKRLPECGGRRLAKLCYAVIALSPAVNCAVCFPDPVEIGPRNSQPKGDPVRNVSRRRGNRYRSHSTIALAAGAFVAAAVGVSSWPVRGATPTLYWDGNGIIAGAGSAPSGTWGVSSFWSTSSTGIAPTTAYTSDASTIAGFSAGGDATGPFTVTMSGTQLAGGLAIEEGNVTFLGAAGTGLNLANGAIDVASTASATVNTSISGSNGLTKTGAGTLTLGSSNSYTGGTLLGGGTLSISSNNRLGDNGAQFGGGITFAGGILKTTDALDTRARSILLLSSASIVDNDTFLTLGGVISGSGTLVKNGLGRLTLGGPAITPNTFTGGIVLNAGTLDIGSDSKYGAPNSGFTFNGGGFECTGDNVFTSAGRGLSLIGPGGTIDTVFHFFTFPGVISGTAPLTKAGVGSLTLLGNNTFTGDFIVKGGTVNLDRDNASGVGNKMILSPISNITLSVNVGIPAINLSSDVTVNSSAFTIDLSPEFIAGHDPTLTFAGKISGAGALNRGLNGNAGTVVLSGDNSAWSGGMTLRQGLLKIGHKNALGTGAFKITPGATSPTLSASVPLTGSNAVNTPVTINDDFTITGPNDLELHGNVNITGPSTITTQGTGETILSGTVTTGPTGSLYKGGLGTLTLAGNNNQISLIYLLDGTVRLGAPKSIARSSPTGSLIIYPGTTTGVIEATTDLTGANALQNYSLDVQGDFTVSGTHGIDLRSTLLNGSHTITVTNTGQTLFTTGVFGDTSVLTKAGPGTLSLTLRVGGLNITQGSARLLPKASPSSTNKIGTLTLAPSTHLDLDNQTLILNMPVGTMTGSSYNGVTGMIQQGRGPNGGALWDGATGIITTQSAAVAGNYTSIAVATGAEAKNITGTTTALWAGGTVMASDTLVMYTYGGDATLDGQINIDDYTRIDSAIGTGAAGWSNGDFNYDGKIDIDDYTIIDSNILAQGAPFATTGSAELGGGSGVTAVPEPAMGVIFLTGAAGLGLRRRRWAKGRS
jgi:autotransporter-associated beta strand protein